MKSAFVLNQEFKDWVSEIDPFDFVLTENDFVRAKKFMPEVEIGGTLFRHVTNLDSFDEKDRLIGVCYQSTDPIHTDMDDRPIYPLLDIWIRVHTTKGGKNKVTIERKGYIHKTKLS